MEAEHTQVVLTSEIAMACPNFFQPAKSQSLSPYTSSSLTLAWNPPRSLLLIESLGVFSFHYRFDAVI